MKSQLGTNLPMLCLKFILKRRKRRKLHKSHNDRKYNFFPFLAFQLQVYGSDFTQCILFWMELVCAVVFLIYLPSFSVFMPAVCFHTPHYVQDWHFYCAFQILDFCVFELLSSHISNSCENNVPWRNSLCLLLSN